MSNAETIRDKLQLGLKMLAFKSVRLGSATMSDVEEVMKEEGWDTISGVTTDGAEHSQYFYNSMQKNYAQVVCNDSTGECEVRAADETEMLQSMSFPELQQLGKLIDKKSVAFIRIFSEKELASAKTEEELRALNERNEKMIAEAEIALRKR